MKYILQPTDFAESGCTIPVAKIMTCKAAAIFYTALKTEGRARGQFLEGTGEYADSHSKGKVRAKERRNQRPRVPLLIACEP